MADALTQYKLIVLYMLDRANLNLSNTQISNFILHEEYTDYFTLQQTLNELMFSDLITTESTHNNTLYHITNGGKETLAAFPDKVSHRIKEDIIAYFEENKIELRQEVSIIADFRRIHGQEYEAHCQIRDKGKSVLNLRLLVSSREQAQAICKNWQANHEEVFENLMDTLLK